jgi:hypothetical protein
MCRQYLKTGHYRFLLIPSDSQLHLHKPILSAVARVTGTSVQKHWAVYSVISRHHIYFSRPYTQGRLTDSARLPRQSSCITRGSMWQLVCGEVHLWVHLSMIPSLYFRARADTLNDSDSPWAVDRCCKASKLILHLCDIVNVILFHSQILILILPQLISSCEVSQPQTLLVQPRTGCTFSVYMNRL